MRLFLLPTTGKLLPKNEVSGTTFPILLGLSGLYLFALFAWLGTAIATAGLGLMLLATVWNGRRAGPVLIREPLFQLFLLFALYVLIRAGFADDQFPDTAGAQWEAAFDWIWLGALFLPAFWMGGRTRRVRACLALGLAGFVLKVLWETDLGEWQKVLAGHRHGFSFVELMAGLLAGCGFLGLLAFARRLWGPTDHPLLFTLRLAVWVLLLLLLTQILITSQSRGAWAATIAGTVFLALPLARDLYRTHKGAPFWVALILLTAGLAWTLQANWNTFEHRIGRSQGTMEKLVSGASVSEIPYSSVGRRIHMWNLGLTKGIERPILGWGPGSVLTRLFDPSSLEDPDLKKEARRLQRHPHLHNGYLAVFARLGLLGGFLLALFFAGVIQSGWRAYREVRMPQDLMLFLTAMLIAHGLWNLIDFRILHVDYRHMVFLLAGAALTYRLQDHQGISGLPIAQTTR